MEQDTNLKKKRKMQCSFVVLIFFANEMTTLKKTTKKQVEEHA